MSSTENRATSQEDAAATAFKRRFMRRMIFVRGKSLSETAAGFSH
jgi:hypothetical protein